MKIQNSIDTFKLPNTHAINALYDEYRDHTKKTTLLANFRSITELVNYITYRKNFDLPAEVSIPYKSPIGANINTNGVDARTVAQTTAAAQAAGQNRSRSRGPNNNNLKEVSMQDVIVVGIDVYRNDTTMVCNLTSISATAEYFAIMSTWYSRLEFVDQIRINFTKCLYAYFEKNNKFPAHIALFRNGIPIGDMLLHAFNVELEEIQSAIREVYLGEDDNLSLLPKFTFIGVSLKSFSPEVIDDVMARSGGFDFMIVSSLPGQLVFPCRYYVLFDNSGLQPEEIQQMTYDISRMYYNAGQTTEMRLPALCKFEFVVYQMVFNRNATEFAENEVFFHFSIQ